MNDYFTEELFYSANGQLIRISAKSVEDRSIELQLEQIEFNSNNKLPKILSNDSFSYTLEKSKKKFSKILLKKNKNNFQNFPGYSLNQGFIFHTKLVNENGLEISENSYKVIAVVFNHETSSFEFDPILSSNLTNLTANLNKKNLTFQVVTKNNARAFYTEVRRNEIILKIFDQIGTKTQNSQMSLLSENNINEFDVISWVEIGNNELDEDFIGQTHLILAKVKYENEEILLKMFWFDVINETFLQVNSEMFLNEYFLIRSGLEPYKQDFNNLDAFLSVQFNKETLNYEIENFHLTQFGIKVNNERLIARGDGILILNKLDGASSFIIYLKKGKIVKRLDLNFVCQETKLKGGCLIVKKTSSKQSAFSIYSLNDEDLKLVEEIFDSEEILYDYFLKESDNCGFLVIKDWLNCQIDLKGWFGSNIILEESKFDDMMNLEDECEIDIQSRAHITFKSNDQNENKSKKQNCMNVLYSVLENKKHLSELLLKEALEEANKKRSFIFEAIDIKNQYLETNLTKLIKLYSSNSQSYHKISLEDRTKQNIQLELKSTWTCYLDQSFFFNFIFKNSSSEKIELLNVIFLPKTESYDLVNLEMKQNILKLDENYDPEDNDLEDHLFNSLSTWKCDPLMSQEINLNQCFLLSCQLSPKQFEKIISNFPNGEISFVLQISCKSNRSQQAFIRKKISIRMSIFDHFTNDRIDHRFLLSINSQRQTGSKSFIKLKCNQIDFQTLNELIIKDMKFEKAKYELNQKSVLIMRQQSLLSDVICFIQPDPVSIFSSYLSVLCRSIVKSKFKESSIELDLRSQIDNLLKYLEDEVNAKIDFNKDESSEGEKMEIDTNEVKIDQNFSKMEDIFLKEQKSDQIILNIFN